MSYVAWIERHGRSIIFIFLALTIAGALAAYSLPVELFPM